MKISFKAQLLGAAEDGVLFEGGDAASEGGIFLGIDEIGGVLAHEGEADVGYRKEVRQAVEDGGGVVAAAGED